MTIENYPTQHRELVDGLKALGEMIPGPMAGYMQMQQAATAEGAIPAVTKQLMALAIVVAGGCEVGIAHHVHDALQAGATKAELEETLGVAVMMGGGLATVCATEALKAAEQFTAEIHLAPA